LLICKQSLDANDDKKKLLSTPQFMQVEVLKQLTIHINESVVIFCLYFLISKLDLPVAAPAWFEERKKYHKREFNWLNVRLTNS
jgi:hypothetical protein